MPTALLDNPIEEKAAYLESVVSWNVKTLLNAQGLSQTALGSAMGISRSAMSKKLSGSAAWSLADLVHAADFLHTSPEELLDSTLMRQFGFAVNEKLTKIPTATRREDDSELLRLGLNQRPSD